MAGPFSSQGLGMSDRRRGPEVAVRAEFDVDHESGGVTPNKGLAIFTRRQVEGGGPGRRAGLTWFGPSGRDAVS